MIVLAEQTDRCFAVKCDRQLFRGKPPKNLRDLPFGQQADYVLRGVEAHYVGRLDRYFCREHVKQYALVEAQLPMAIQELLAHSMRPSKWQSWHSAVLVKAAERVQGLRELEESLLHWEVT